MIYLLSIQDRSQNQMVTTPVLFANIFSGAKDEKGQAQGEGKTEGRQKKEALRKTLLWPVLY